MEKFVKQGVFGALAERRLTQYAGSPDAARCEGRCSTLRKPSQHSAFGDAA